jgi:hypothetical protein
VPVSRSLRSLSAVVLLSGALAACGPDGEIHFVGPEEDTLVNADALSDLEFAATATEGETVADLVLHHNGVEVAPTEQSATDLRWTPQDLDDGAHTVTVVRGAPADTAPLHEWVFQVDRTPPEIVVTAPTTAVVAGAPVTVAGTVEPGAALTVSGEDAEVAADGAFEVTLATVPDGAVTLLATDAAGNTSSQELELRTVPSRVEISEIRAVHVTSHAWAHDGLRSNVLAMIDAGRINAIQLDLKDEGGRVGYRSEVELANASGAVEGVFDLHAAVAELHERGVPVIGRIVAFRDGKLGQWAIDNGHTDWLIQTADGQPYTGRYECCFTDFAHPEVIEYNLAIAEEAAAAGVDSILWDYIRRPDGPVENLRFPGIGDRTPEQAIVDFTEIAHERLAPYGIQHGVSVYGITATRPTQIGQDIPGLAQHVDFIAPMVYPSHWGPGEYDLSDPNRAPFDIVARALQGFLDAVEGTDTRIVPWLEDTAYRAWDRPHQIREQIRGAASIGIDEWMMWDPNVRYTPDAYAARD